MVQKKYYNTRKLHTLYQTKTEMLKLEENPNLKREERPGIKKETNELAFYEYQE